MRISAKNKNTIIIKLLLLFGLDKECGDKEGGNQVDCDMIGRVRCALQ